MIEILIGPICSGKGTYARGRAQGGAIVVNDDAIVKAVHGGDYTLYSKSLKPLYRSVEMSIITAAVSLGRDVIIDRGNCMNPSCRRKYVGIGRSLDQEVIAVLFPNQGPEWHANARFNKNDRGLPLEHWLGAAQRHQSEFRPPTLEEGFTEISTIEGMRAIHEWNQAVL